MMEAECNELEKNIGIIGDRIIEERRRLIGNDGRVPCCEAREVLGAKGRFDEDYDSVFGVKDIVEAIYVDEYGAGVVWPGSIEDISVWT